MITRTLLFSACVAAVICVGPRGVQGQKGESQAKKSESQEFGDRITPIVRVVQKCQGSVVAFMNPETGKPKGTGVIVDARGLIVTNAHVVGADKTFKIQLIDKSEHVGKLLALKSSVDLAVVKITTATKLDALAPTTSDTVYLGEDVIAIGHPYGYSYSITRGILSATGRKIDLPTGATIDEVYQISAAINPGNSGGPLFNVFGDLIGINFAMRSDAQEIAFTIPAKKVRQVLAQLAQ